jgi:cytochrome c oxidase subunit 2
MAVSTSAEVFSQLFLLFTVLGTIVGAVVISYMAYLAWRYRARGQPVARPPPQEKEGRELLLSVALSTLVVVSLIAFSVDRLHYLNTLPAEGEALNIQVIGFQFGWRFVYPNGYSSVGNLTIPVGRPIVLNVTSQDVYHKFAIIEFGSAAIDAIPGQVNRIWFTANATGTYHIQCFELCGFGHALMRATLTAVDQPSFDRWYASLNLTKQGE